MIVAVTGTPGTGKTTAVEAVSTDLEVVHLSEHIDADTLTVDRDQTRDSWVVDPDALRESFGDRSNVLVESHLAHYLPADRVVVLRCHPATLTERLRARGESPDSIAENAESEALDGVLTSAVERHGPDAVYEIETTTKSPSAVATAIEAVIEGTREPQVGTVSYLEYLTPHDA